MTKLEERIKKVERKLRDEIIDIKTRTPVDSQEEILALVSLFSTSIREIVKESFKEVGLEENDLKTNDPLAENRIWAYNQAIKERKKKEEEYLK